MQALIDVILPVFFVIGVGYAAAWSKILSEESIEGTMRFATRVAVPVFLFGSIARLDLGADFALDLLGTYYTVVFAMFLLALFGSRLLFKRPWPDCVAIGFCCLFMNSVLLGLPIAERAYGADALAPHIAIIAIHAPFCFGIGVTVMEIVRGAGHGVFGTIRNILDAMFHNALVIGIMAGFVVNLTGLPLPAVAWDAVDLIARAALPVALIAMGGVLYRYKPEGDMGPVVFICAITLVIQPALTWGLGRAVDLSPQAFRAAVLTASMAPGINAYIFADYYGVARRVAATSVLVTTGLALLTVWFWLTMIG